MRRGMLAALMPELVPGHIALPGDSPRSDDYWPGHAIGFADRPDAAAEDEAVEDHSDR